MRVRARDTVANTETPSSRSFTIDRDDPETTIDSNPADPTASTSADFDFSADEPGSTFECRIDGGAWGACTRPASYTSLTDGSHIFDVRATDVAGNTDGSPASYTWLVDTTAPSSTTTFPAAAGSYTNAEWDAGCAAAGLCGTYGDGSGSGVAEVEVSIRRAPATTGTAPGFTSATEVWNDSTLAAGDWATTSTPPTSPPTATTPSTSARATTSATRRRLPAAPSRSTRPRRPRRFLSPRPAASTTSPAGTRAARRAGLCGTHFDGTSGVAEVEVSVRQGSGDYWDGSGFTSATEVWNDADLAAGDWAYELRRRRLPRRRRLHGARPRPRRRAATSRPPPVARSPSTRPSPRPLSTRS